VQDAQPGLQFSLDLVAAVKRQASFIAQVAAVGWTQPRPKGIDTVAAGSIDKYHGFLKKLWANPEALAVPTLVSVLSEPVHKLVHFERYYHINCVADVIWQEIVRTNRDQISLSSDRLTRTLRGIHINSIWTCIGKLIAILLPLFNPLSRL
jgi:hypothetical protein